MINNYPYALRYLLNQAPCPTLKSANFSGTEQQPSVAIPEEFNGRDYLAFLLSIDAELEHALMVQYLYAAYSLGGSQVPESGRETVRRWQEIVLGIAKEEMGHFVSVQNVLRLIGAPLHFERRDFPWDTPFNPFPFKLEPLSKESLAKYIYTESPEGWIDTPITDNKLLEEVRLEIKAIIGGLDNIGSPISVLFKTIEALIQDKVAVPDSVFQADSYAFQGKLSEWGRGYSGGRRGSTLADATQATPDVLVAALASRTDAIASLKGIASQGEDASLLSGGKINLDNPLSHFERFLVVYIEMRNVNWAPARNLAINPYVPAGDPAHEQRFNPSSSEYKRDAITNPLAAQWFHLLNVRYRMLLAFIHHSFVLDQGFSGNGASPRGTIINASFGEMYNIRSISNVLVKTPIDDTHQKMAGPGFLIPYTLDLPVNERNRWLVHFDLIQASQRLVEQLLPLESCETHRDYLHSLSESDNNLLAIIQQLID